MTRRISGKENVPSLKGFFLAHGAGIGERRIVRPFHEQMFSAITRWMSGTLPDGKVNLYLAVPPGHTKTYVARDTISYGMGLWPDCQWLYTSYAAPLAVEQTFRVKNAINSEWYQSIFPWVGSADGTQDKFRTRHGGIVYGVGTGGAITGFRGGQKRNHFSGGIVIDDPLKADEARSEAARRHLWEWYTGTLMSRKNRNDTPTLMIAQRLHPEDLPGMIKKNFPESWHFLEIPAVDEVAKTTIWPETFSYEAGMKLKAVDPFAYSSQYQQTPTIPGGAMIKEEWWRYYDNVDAIRAKCDTFFITADTAYGKKDFNDYSVFQCWGTNGRLLYLLDQVRGRWDYPELTVIAKEFFQKHEPTDPHYANQTPLRMFIENKASGQSLVQQYDEFRADGEGVNAFPWNVKDYLEDGKQDKVARVNACLSAIHGGNVILPDTPEATWIDGFIAECSAFSWDESHSHDDQVDCLTMAILYWKSVLRGGA